MNVDVQVSGEPIRNVDGDLPFAIADGLRGPTECAEARGTLADPNLLAGSEPMLRSSFLQMADIVIALFVAQQPAQPERRLQNAVHHRGPGVGAAIAGKTAGQIGIFRRIAVAAIR